MAKLAENEILKVDGLKKYFPITQGFFNKHVGDVKAVNDISFTLNKGETMGLVGESGCGKTTASRSILRAIDPTEGEVLFRRKNGNVVDLAELDYNKLKDVRSEIQMIFQDPFSSLNPRMSVLDIIAEPLVVQGWPKEKYKARVEELLDLVGLDKKYMTRYPHAFSGGQRQRIGIARALALEPELVVADEPVSALDVSVQAQILNLLDDLKERMNLTLLMVAHDLSVIRYICDKVAVMYLGKLVEIADTEELYTNPKHPYTASLLTAVPEADPHVEWLGENLKGEVPDPSAEIKGCNFASRCPYAKDICENKEPELVNIGDNHWVSCHRKEEIDLTGVK
ncbi:peptide/nickel transport system ATP-binding protein [Halanaerobium saccharolyticum]|jgi:peptide/nickel transport system ATP-binding protein|uniref:Peptide/nickel transport system ATP-binding protein n=1 Tax=Halanaerobium saccharolyticum TaxID=43595 RepID=A0A2T5RJG4_9FIRM|nr:ABC transporter ATP-binding protein [Halanaerobium saccharolyticum]PTV98744.1 peptide/nickel transport system ATP-binding protein [Halanaerobium saccharolyticum]